MRKNSEQVTKGKWFCCETRSFCAHSFVLTGSSQGERLVLRSLCENSTARESQSIICEGQRAVKDTQDRTGRDVPSRRACS